MKRARLTAIEVGLAHRAGQPVLLADGDGLWFRKQTAEGASWLLRYAHAMTLGNYPDMSLSQARIEARQARVTVDRKQDPLRVRREAT